MSREIELLPGRWIGGNHPCFIIAEIGQNHQGNVDIAKKMILEAKICGADCVKFQKSCLSAKFNVAALHKPYKSEHSWGETYGEHKKHLELSETVYKNLQSYAEEIGIAFTASGMDNVSMDFLDKLGVPFFKVGSGDTNNFPLLVHTAKKGKPMVISSGMQTLETMKKVYNLVKPINDQFCFLQCTSSYPTSPQDVNLKVIKAFQDEFKNIPIGYSGHETGRCISVAAVAMGAKILERHFTLDKTWKGSDHAASLEPAELKKLICEVRIVENAMGGPRKQFLPCEIPCHDKLGKSVVAAVTILKGDLIREEMLEIKVAVPKGYMAEKLEDLIGKTTRREIRKDESVLESDVEQ